MQNKGGIRMKKIVKKLIISVLSISLTLVGGCGTKALSGNMSEKKIAMGRFVEQDVEMGNLDLNNEYLSEMVVTKAGLLRLYSWGEGLEVYTQSQTGLWEKEELIWMDEFKKMCNGWIENITIDKEDNICIAYIELDEKNNAYTRIAKVQNNKVSKINVKWKGEEDFVKVSSMALVPNGDLLISQFSHLERYSLETGELIKTYDEEGSRIVVIDNEFYALNTEKNIINVFNIESNTLQRTIPCENVDDETLMAVGNNGDIYLVSRYGIAHLNKNGSIWELLVDGSLTSLGMPTYFYNSIAVLNNEIYVSFNKNEGGNLFKKYVYSKDTPTVPGTEIIAYTLKDNSTLRQVATQFQLMNPNVKVTIQVGLENDSTITRSDAIKSLNTELLAGKGPDIMVLDGLNAQTYIEKGILDSLKNISKEALDSNQYLTNITNAYTINSETYAVPTRFGVPILGGDKELLQKFCSIEDMISYRKNHPDVDLLSYKTPEELICKFYTVCAPSWVNENKELQEDKLKTFLEAIKVLSYQGKLKETKFPQTREYFMRKGHNGMDCLDVAYNDASFQVMIPVKIYDLLVSAATNKQRGNGDFKPLIGQCEGVFEPYCSLAINAASEHKELAQEIIKMGLSEEIQNNDTGDGYPVNKQSFENWINGKSFDQSLSYSFGEGSDRKVSVEWGYEEELKRFYGICEKMTLPSAIDENLLEIVLEGSKGYFEDSMTIDEAMNGIKEKIVIYLSE